MKSIKLIILTSALVGCSLNYYKAEILQGDQIPDFKICSISKGLTKNQVEYLFGKPIINNNNTKDPEIWSYTYYKNDETLINFNIYFKNNALNHVSWFSNKAKKPECIKNLTL